LQQDFQPLISNPHLLTIAGNFWRRKIDTTRFPARRVEYRIDAKTTVISFEHQPASEAGGQIIFLHGLEGSADAGYIASFAQTALLRGFAVHRMNLRTCGGTEGLCETMYHSGLTSDTRFVLERLKDQGRGPRFLVGFSLGGNVTLKLAGELGHTDLLTAVCAISTPIDLAACVRTMDKPSNRLYARRFLDRLRSRVKRKSRITPGVYGLEGLEEVRTIWEFDDRFTAPLFGFGSAANYYATQSAIRYLDAIRIPALVIAAKDDPLVPFEIYAHPAFTSNPCITLAATDYGGHLGFISRRNPRFWLDTFALNWITGLLPSSNRIRGTKAEHFTSA
jgi:predicted alpha/beta-fold hydrolase